METGKPNKPGQRARGTRLPHRFRDLLHELLFYANRGIRRPDFLRQACSILLEFSGTDDVEVLLESRGELSRCRALLTADGGFLLEDEKSAPQSGTGKDPLPEGEVVPERILRSVLSGRFAAPAPFYTRSGSFWTGDTARPILVREEGDRVADSRTVVIGGEFQSLALLPIPVDDQTSGVLLLASRRRDFFTKDDIQFYEAVAETLGVALAHQSAQWALRERVKELTCLYGAAKVAQRPGIPLDDLLQETVNLLPAGWQYPEITGARITYGSKVVQSPAFQDSPQIQSAQIMMDGKPRGLVEVVYTQEKPDLHEGPFLAEERRLIDAVAETLGGALAYREAQSALKERVKELTCVYGIARLAQRPGISTEELLQEIVDLLPPAWQYPEITTARILLDGKSHETQDFAEIQPRQEADIVVNGEVRGRVEVVYAKPMPDHYEGPFLKEERSLINQVAGQIGNIIERREVAEERSRLQEQLRHADRLATIGQLSAGAAHELNEPLGSILGFAQLAKDCPGVPDQAQQDMDKIVNAALHAREVIRKLMIFARQMPTRKSLFDLNKLILEGFYFLESRCAKEGVKLVRNLDPGLPQITADPAQIHQVLVNLMVNAIQSMPQGGTMTIQTRGEGDQVIIEVEDTGVGMDQEVLKQMFVPFFTTKEVGKGTGLGLSVVHGIVTSHGGKIRAESIVGKGSRFEVRLPMAPASRQEIS